MSYRAAALAAALVTLAACSDASLSSYTSPPGQPAANAGRAGAAGVTVMTRNLYIGADVDQVIAALASPDPNDDFPALLGAIQTLGETDFPTRAKALANEIARAHPHAVGLQEVTQLDIDLSALGLPTTIHLDFLATLQAELASRGFHYVVAAEVTNIQAAPIPGISLVDHDALLVDADRVTLVGSPIARNFSINIGVVAPGVELKRGYVAVQARINGAELTLASTHLESGSAPGLNQLRAAQAGELAAVLAPSTRAIVLGDFNDLPGSPMYQVLSGAGWSDRWLLAHPGSEGLTCCQPADLSNESARFDQRIDYVLTRGLAVTTPDQLGAVSLVGNLSTDRIPGPAHPIWPSDHAGVLASIPLTLLLP